MGYIGVQPEAGFTSGLLDRFTSTTGSTVTLTHDISSENDIIVFVNFVKQDSTNYSVGGSGNKTLTLGGTLVSSDIVEVHYLNVVKLTQQPSANSVGVTELNLSEGTSGQALTTNGSGTLSFSTIASGITMADHWRLTADFTGSGVGQLTSNLARVNVDGFTQIGTGMTESSGVFTFPTTGMYLIFCHGDFLTTSNSSGYSGLYIRISTDGGSSYATRSQSWTSIFTSGVYGAVQNNQLFNVTNTSTHKVMFRYELNNSQKIEGSANSIRSHFIFIRLGDST